MRDGLTLKHLAWRRRKIASFNNQEWKFIQEYPFNPEEAFIRAEGRFYDLVKVYSAQRRQVEVCDFWPLVIGIDQGRTGDSTEISRRRGRKIFPIQTIPPDDGVERDMRLAGVVAKIIDLEDPDLVVFDTTNEHGALDRLHELGYSKRVVRGIHFGEKANDPLRYRNKRVEMGFEFKEWLDNDDGELPDDQQFVSEIGALPAAKESSNNVAYFVPKEEIKKILGWSPNKLDAVWLTFAFRVRKRSMNAKQSIGVSGALKVANFISALKTFQR